MLLNKYIDLYVNVLNVLNDFLSLYLVELLSVYNMCDQISPPIQQSFTMKNINSLSENQVTLSLPK